jgi:type II secretory pathway pseudopilin PulG
MPDIYLSIDGQQAGPYQPAQVRQLLAEGKATAETPAWHQALMEWSTVGVVLAAFPSAGGPPPYVAPTPPPPPPRTVPVKQGMNAGVIAAIIAGVFFIGIFVISCLAGIALGPITNGIKKAKENASMQSARAIDLAMFSYATDHNGAYPEGGTSTEVFQKLIDEKYVADPALFYVQMPGKTKATSDKLTADNVCYDVTSGATVDSPGSLPMVFSTGYTMTYSAGANVTVDSGMRTAFPGIAVAYKSNSAHFYQALPNGEVAHVVSADFPATTQKYQQLKP